jgi:hypothetical protein
VICSPSIDLGLGIGHAGLGLGQLHLAVQARPGALLAQAQQGLALAQRALCHFLLGNQPGQGDIAARHLCGQLVGGGGAVGLGGARLAQCGLQVCGMLAEEVGRPGQAGLSSGAGIMPLAV